MAEPFAKSWRDIAAAFLKVGARAQPVLIAAGAATGLVIFSLR
jgi:hypothetical protein